VKRPLTEHYLSLDFNKIWLLTYKLYRQLKESSYQIEVLVGITRGGYVITRILSDLLAITEVVTVGVAFYKGINQTKSAPQITQELAYDIRGKRILVVDDVADTGKSLKEVTNYLSVEQPSGMKIATLHYKPQSIYKPDFYVQETTAWIIYPWEWAEFTRIFIATQLKKGLTLEEIKKELLKLAIPELVVKEEIAKRKEKE
jgi:hypothetical protein